MFFVWKIRRKGATILQLRCSHDGRGRADGDGEIGGDAMKKGLWYIFKCQNCGKVFQQKEKAQNLNIFDEPKDLKDCAEHIGVKRHIVSTHKCKPGVYGCATLIGCQIWGKEALNDELLL